MSTKQWVLLSSIIVLFLASSVLSVKPDHRPLSEKYSKRNPIKSTIDKLMRREHVTIVALGDSITANTLHNRGHMNWVSLLDEAIFEKYGPGVCMIINAGIAGSNYSDALNRLDRDVLRFKPDLVIIALGMNDADKGIDYLPQFKEDVRQVIKYIRECNGEVMLMTPNPIVVETGYKWKAEMNPGDIFDAWPLSEYSQALLEIAKETGCVIVDHYNAWKGCNFPTDKLYKEQWAYQFRLWPRMANSTHPGPLGHLAFYREIAEVFDLPRYFAWEGR